MQKILNCIKINELIVTSGQPKVEEFEFIANEGFEVIINLATYSSSNAIENEDKINAEKEQNKPYKNVYARIYYTMKY